MLKARLKPSWTLAAILTAAHCAVVALIIIVEVPVWLSIIVVALLGVNLVSNLGNAALLRARGAAVALEITSAGLFSVQTRRGAWIECEVLGSTYVASFLTVLNLKEQEKGALRHVVILPDSMDAEDFRRLRVWLRWKHGTQPPPG